MESANNEKLSELEALRKENEELKKGLNSIFQLVSHEYPGLKDKDLSDDPKQLMHWVSIIFSSLETKKTLLDQNLKALNSVSDGIAIFNDRGKVVFSNRSFGKMFKINKDDLTDMHWREIFVGDYYQPIKTLAREINENYPVHKEIIINTKKKNYFFNSSIFPLSNGNILANVTNITAEKERQHKIQEQTTLIKRANEFIGICDLSFNFTFLNDHGLKMVNKKNVDGLKFIDLVDVKTKEEITTGLLKKELWEGEFSIKLNGKAKPVACTIQLFVPTKFTPGGYYILLQDITQRKKTIQKLENAKEVAEHNAKIRQQFLANMSHEIRTPMNAIIGLSNLLQDTPLERKQKELADSIKLSAENLLVIINDILDISKIESGKLNVEKIPFKFSNTIDVIQKTFRHKIDEKGLRFIFDIDDQIPPYLIGDPTRLSQILLNLISNAIKFTNEGSVGFKVEIIKQSQRNVHLRFTIEDSGIGISKENQKRIFLPFTQENDSTTRKYGGTGLGLAIVKQLVELQKGNIKLSSKLNEGSTFSVDIPFGISENLNASTGRFNHHFDNSKVKNAKIIMAEDYPMNQLLAQNLFEKWGLNLKIVNNGKELIQELSKKSYDIVLMDVQMPEMDGIEATRKIRQRGEKIPIIAITAHAFKEEQDQCLNAGMNDFLAKPFNEKELVEKLVTYLNLKPSDLDSIKEIYKTQTTKAQKLRNKAFGLSYLLDMGTGDELFVKEMLLMFVEQVPLLLKEIIEFYNEEDKDNLAKHAHTIQSSLGLVDRNDLRMLFKKIELWCKGIESLMDPNNVIIDAINQTKEVIADVAEHVKYKGSFDFPAIKNVNEVEDNSEVTINLAKVKELGEGNSKFMADMLNLYIEQTKEQLINIDKLIEKKQVKKIELIVHNMIGSFELVGCEKLVTYAINIESICKGGKLNQQLINNLDIFKKIANQSFTLIEKACKKEKIKL